MKTRQSHLKAMRILALAAASALSATPSLLPAQPVAILQVQPLSELRAGWLNGGAPSPNERFFALRSYDGDKLNIFDARTGKWNAADEVTLGNSLVWSPDGRFLATAKRGVDQRERRIWIVPMDTATGRPAGTGRSVSMRRGDSPAWSPDGKRIAFVNNDSGTFRIVAVPFNGGDEQVLHAEPGVGQHLFWSADGRMLFAMFGKLGWENWLRYDVATRAVTRMKSSSGWPIVGLSPDGQRVAAINNSESELLISSTRDGKLLGTYHVPHRYSPAAWTKDGKGLIGAEYVVPSHVETVRVSSGAVTSLTVPDSVFIRDVLYSPDGTQLLFNQNRRGTTQLYVMPSRGGAPRAVGNKVGGRIGMYNWSPTGKSVVYCQARNIHVVDVVTGKDQELVPMQRGHGSPRPYCAWRADGAAIRWLRSSGGQHLRTHELHETTLSGADRIIARFETAGHPTILDDSLVIVRSEEGLKVRNVVRQEDKLLFKGNMWTAQASWSPDRASLAFLVDENGSAIPYVLNVRSGAARRIPYSLGGEINSVQYLPDGRSLVAYACISCVEPKFVERWDIVLIPLTGDPVRVLTASQSAYSDHGDPSISPDGQTIAFEGEISYNTRVSKVIIPRQ